MSSAVWCNDERGRSGYSIAFFFFFCIVDWKNRGRTAAVVRLGVLRGVRSGLRKRERLARLVHFFHDCIWRHGLVPRADVSSSET